MSSDPTEELSAQPDIAATLDALPQAGEMPQQTQARVDTQTARADRLAASTDREQQRITGRDLANRGIAHFTTPTGRVQEITDPTGSPMVSYDKRNSVAWDSTGNPHKISFDVMTGQPITAPAYDNAPTTTDKAGNIYKTPAGLPWQQVGVDPQIAAQVQQKTKATLDREADSALAAPQAQQSARYRDAFKVVRQSAKDTQAQFSALGLPATDPTGQPAYDLNAPDPEALRAHIESSFNREYAAPEANAKPFLGGGQFSSDALKLRADIDNRKQQANDLAGQHVALAGQMQEERAALDDIITQRQALKSDQLATVNAKRVAAGLDPVRVPKIPGLDTLAGAAPLGEADGSNAPVSAAPATTQDEGNLDSIKAALPPHAQQVLAPPKVDASGKVEPEGFWGTVGRAFGSKILPAAATAVGGLGAGALALESGPGAIAADIAGGALAGTAAAKAQRSAMDGIMGAGWADTNDAQMDANARAHPVAAQLGAIVPFLVSMLGGGGALAGKAVGAAVKTEGKTIANAATSAGKSAIEDALATGVKYQAPMTERVAQQAILGGRAGLSEGAQEKYADGKDVNPLDAGARGAVTMGALGLFPAAKTLLGQVFGKSATDAAAVTLAGNLYDAGVHGKPFSLDDVANEMAGDYPAFVLQNALLGFLHHGGLPPAKGGEGKGPPAVPGLPEGPTGGAPEIPGLPQAPAEKPVKGRVIEPPEESKPPTPREEMNIIDIRLKQIQNSPIPAGHEQEREGLIRRRAELMNGGEAENRPNSQKVPPDVEAARQQLATAKALGHTELIAEKQQALDEVERRAAAPPIPGVEPLSPSREQPTAAPTREPVKTSSAPAAVAEKPSVEPQKEQAPSRAATEAPAGPVTATQELATLEESVKRKPSGMEDAVKVAEEKRRIKELRATLAPKATKAPEPSEVSAPAAAEAASGDTEDKPISSPTPEQPSPAGAATAQSHKEKPDIAATGNAPESHSESPEKPATEQAEASAPPIPNLQPHAPTETKPAKPTQAATEPRTPQGHSAAPEPAAAAAGDRVAYASPEHAAEKAASDLGKAIKLPKDANGIRAIDSRGNVQTFTVRAGDFKGANPMAGEKWKKIVAVKVDHKGKAEPVTGKVMLAAGEQSPPKEAAPQSKTAGEQVGDKPTIDTAAHTAATSAKNDLAHPTEAQQEAGNYQKGHVVIGGLNIAIENPAGSKRRPEWPALKSHYGYINGTLGKDGDHIDVFIKPGTPLEYAGPVFVVNQTDAKGAFDEHKAVIGAKDKDEARAIYLSNYSKGWNGGGDIAAFPTVETFKQWATGARQRKAPAKSSAPSQTPGAKSPDVATASGAEHPSPSSSKPTTTTPAPPTAAGEQSEKPKSFTLPKNLFAGAPSPSQSFKEPLPRDKAAVFQQAAFDLLDQGLNTPEQLAKALEENYEGRARAFTGALWKIMESVGAPEVERPNWQEIYAGLETPKMEQRKPEIEGESARSEAEQFPLLQVPKMPKSKEAARNQLRRMVERQARVEGFSEEEIESTLKNLSYFKAGGDRLQSLDKRLRSIEHEMMPKKEITTPAQMVDQRQRYWVAIKRGILDMDGGGDVRLVPSYVNEKRFDVLETKDGQRTMVSDPGKPMPIQEAQDFAVNYALKQTPMPKAEAPSAPLNMAGKTRAEMRPQRAPKEPVPEFTMLPPRSQQRFNEAWNARDAKAMNEILDPRNRGLRAEWESRTGTKLPKTMRDADAAVIAYFNAQESGMIRAANAAATGSAEKQEAPKTVSAKPSESSKSPADISSFLHVEVPDADSARAKVAAFNETAGAIQKEAMDLEDAIKKLAPEVVKTTGRSWDRGQIKKSAPKAKVKQYLDWKQQIEKKNDAIRELRISAAPSAKIERQAMLAKRVSDEKLPLLARLAARREMMFDDWEANGKSIPKALEEAIASEAGKVIRAKYPDATEAEIAKATPKLAALAGHGHDYDRAFEMDADLNISDRRVQELAEFINPNAKQYSVTLGELPQALQDRINATIPHYRTYDKKNDPTAPMSRAEIEAIKADITAERETIKTKKDEQAKLDQEEAAKQALLNAKVNTVEAGNAKTDALASALADAKGDTTKPKVMRAQGEYLQDAIAKAIKEINDESVGRIRFDVPGDGTFIVFNTPKDLRAFAAKTKNAFKAPSADFGSSFKVSGVEQRKAPAKVDDAKLLKAIGEFVSDDPARNNIKHIIGTGDELMASDATMIVARKAHTSGTPDKPAHLDATTGKPVTEEDELPPDGDATAHTFRNYLNSEPDGPSSHMAVEDLYRMASAAEALRTQNAPARIWRNKDRTLGISLFDGATTDPGTSNGYYEGNKDTDAIEIAVIDPKKFRDALAFMARAGEEAVKVNTVQLNGRTGIKMEGDSTRAVINGMDAKEAHPAQMETLAKAGLASTPLEALIEREERALETMREIVKTDQSAKPPHVRTTEDDVARSEKRLANLKEKQSKETDKGVMLSAGTPEQQSAPFYSQLTRTLEALPQETMTVTQAKAAILKGAKGDEIKLSGILDDPLSPLTGKKPEEKVSKSELTGYALERQAKVQDVVLGKPEEGIRKHGDTWRIYYPDGSFRGGFLTQESAREAADFKGDGIGAASTTHFSQYQLPGADEGSYREMFVTWPKQSYAKAKLDTMRILGLNKKPSELSQSEFIQVENAIRGWDGWKDGHSQYSDIANPIVRIRRNIRTMPDGSRTYFLEEIQGPSKTEQEKMPPELRKRIYEIGMKRALRDAVDEGADKIAWTTGEQQAERYDLAKQVEALRYVKQQNGNYKLRMLAKGRGQEWTNIAADIAPEKLTDYVGKEVAQKISNAEGEKDSFTGESTLHNTDLVVGGEGLKRLYDSTLPRIANELAKKFGVKAGQSKIGQEWYSIRENEAGKWQVTSPDDGDVWNPFKTKEEAEAFLDKEEPRWRDAKTVHSLEIPAALREQQRGGNPLFAGKPNHYETKENTPATHSARRPRESGQASATGEGLAQEGEHRLAVSTADVTALPQPAIEHLAAAGVTLREGPDGPAGMNIDTATLTIERNAETIAKHAAAINAAGGDGRQWVDSIHFEEGHHTANLVLTGNSFSAVNATAFRKATPEARKAMLEAYPFTDDESALGAEYLARLSMRRAGVMLPERASRSYLPAVARLERELDKPQDAFIENLWENIETVTAGEPVKAPDSFKDDASQQRNWMNEQAKALGHEDIQHMVSKDAPAFRRLAMQWRAFHGRDEDGNFVTNERVSAINQLLYGGENESKKQGTGGRLAGSSDAAGDALAFVQANAIGRLPDALKGERGEGHPQKHVERETRDQGQSDALVKWAKQNGVCFTSLPHSIALLGKISGSEHDAYPTDHGRWIKVSKGFGLTPEVDPHGELELTGGNAVSYLQRIQDENSLTGDDIRVHAVIARGDNVRLITSQPDVSGDPLTYDDIREDMSLAGFKHAGGSSFYRESDNVAVFDFHTENGRKVDGLALPFDVVVVHPNQQMVKAIKRIQSEMQRNQFRGDPALESSGQMAAIGAGDPNMLHAGIPAPLRKLYDKAAEEIEAAKDEWKVRETKGAAAYKTDAVSTRANYHGQQAGDSIRLDLPEKADREAMPFVIEAGGDPAKLAQFQTDIAASTDPKLAAKYAPIISRAIAEFPRLDSAKGNHERMMADSIAELKARNIDVGEVEDYVTRKLDAPDAIKDVLPNPLFSMGSGQGNNPRYFAKGRVFETLADAIKAGYPPISTDLADLDAHRIEAGKRLAFQKDLFNELKATPAPTDGKPLIGKLETRVLANGETELATPRGYSVVNAAGTPLVIHNDLASTFRDLYGDSAIRRGATGRAALKLAAVVKHGTLAVDTFHIGRMLFKMATAGGGGPFTKRNGHLAWNLHKGRALLEYSDADLGRAEAMGDITKKEADYARANRPKIEKLMEHGMNVGKVADNLMEQAKLHLPVISTLNDWIFGKLSRSAMVQSALGNLERNLRNPAYTEDQAYRQTAKEMNELFGNLQNQGLFKSKTLQDLSRLIFLAPNWTESQFRNEARAYGQAGKSAWNFGTGRGGPPPPGSPPGATGNTFPFNPRNLRLGNSARIFAAGFVALLAVNQIINFLSRGQSTLQNEEEDHKLDAWVPGGKRGFWFNPLEIAGEYAHAAIKYLAQHEHPVDVAAHIASNKLSPLARGVKEAATGRDYAGRHFLSDTDRFRSALTDMLPIPLLSNAGIERDPRQPFGYRLTRQPGAAQKQLMQSVGMKVTPAQSPRSQMFAIAQPFRADRGRSDTAGEYTELRRAIDNDDTTSAKSEIKWLTERGKSMDAISHAMGIRKSGEIAPELFTGGADREIEMVSKLTAEQRKIYALAQRDHLQNAIKFQRIATTVLSAPASPKTSHRLPAFQMP